MRDDRHASRKWDSLADMWVFIADTMGEWGETILKYAPLIALVLVALVLFAFFGAIAARESTPCVVDVLYSDGRRERYETERPVSSRARVLFLRDGRQMQPPVDATIIAECEW